MNVVHRLVGYDRVTDRVADEHAIPERLLDYAKRAAHVPNDDPDVVRCYHLAPSAARDIAGTIGATINLDACDFFLEGFAA